MKLDLDTKFHEGYIVDDKGMTVGSVHFKSFEVKKCCNIVTGLTVYFKDDKDYNFLFLLVKEIKIDGVVMEEDGIEQDENDIIKEDDDDDYYDDYYYIIEEEGEYNE